MKSLNGISIAIFVQSGGAAKKSQFNECECVNKMCLLYTANIFEIAVKKLMQGVFKEKTSVKQLQSKKK